MKRIIAVLVCCVMVGVTGCGSSAGAVSSVKVESSSQNIKEDEPDKNETEQVDLSEITKNEFIDKFVEIGEQTNMSIKELKNTELDNGENAVLYSIEMPKLEQGYTTFMTIMYNDKDDKISSITFDSKGKEVTSELTLGSVGFYVITNTAVSVISPLSYDDIVNNMDCTNVETSLETVNDVTYHFMTMNEDDKSVTFYINFE